MTRTGRIGGISRMSTLAAIAMGVGMLEVGASMGKTMQAAIMAPPPKTGKAKFTRTLQQNNALGIGTRAERYREPRDKKKFKMKGLRP